MYPGLGELGVEGVEVIEREIVDEDNTCILGTSMRKEAPWFPNRRSSIAGLKTDRSPPHYALIFYTHQLGVQQGSSYSMPREGTVRFRHGYRQGASQVPPDNRNALGTGYQAGPVTGLWRSH